MAHEKPLPTKQIVFAATKVEIDNSAAQALAKNKQVSAKIKHIDLKHHFGKDAIKSGTIVLQDIASSENPADMLTKILGMLHSTHCRKIINPLCE